MPSFQIPGQADRVFVPECHGARNYRPHSELISMVRVFDKGPDVQVLVMVRGIPAGQLLVPREDETELRRRLFADPPSSAGAEDFGAMLQDLEDLAGAHAIEQTRLKRRDIVAYVERLRDALRAARRPSMQADGHA